MSDKHIGALTEVTELDDDSMLVAEQQGEAVRVSGETVKKFARAGVQDYENQAKEYADTAQEAADAAVKAREGIDQYVSDAQDAANEAKAAQELAEKAQANAIEAQAGAIAANAAAQTAEANALSAQEKAETAQENAAAEAENASEALMAAQTAQKASEAAQEAAENAQGKAEDASTTATEKASEAAQSADVAKQYSGKPPVVQDGKWWTWNADSGEYTDTGKRAILGYDKTYASVAEMEADTAQEDNTIAIISSSVEDEDNAKLYICNGGKWGYLTDLSGFTGVGVESVELTSGDHSPGTTDVYTLTLTDGTTQSLPVYNGLNGDGTGDMESSVYDPNGKKQDIYQYVDDAIDAIPTPDVSGQIGTHNTSEDAHQDIRNAKLDKTGDGSNVTVSFDSASDRDDIATGDTVSTLFGKIAKWFSDLGNLAFKSSVEQADLASDVQDAILNAGAKPIRVTVHLLADNWEDGTQAVTASGVSADEADQLIISIPASDSQTAYYDACITCNAQAEDSLTFICTVAPTVDVTVYVIVYELG